MNEKKYVSTRGQQRPLDFCDAILQGIGSDGGLLVPDFELDQKDLKALQHLSYVDMATEIMTSFVGEQEKEEMRALCQKLMDKIYFLRKLFLLNRQEMFLSLNYSRDQQPLLKIWHYHYCHIL